MVLCVMLFMLTPCKSSFDAVSIDDAVVAKFVKQPVSVIRPVIRQVAISLFRASTESSKS